MYKVKKLNMCIRKFTVQNIRKTLIQSVLKLPKNVIPLQKGYYIYIKKTPKSCDIKESSIDIKGKLNVLITFCNMMIYNNKNKA